LHCQSDCIFPGCGSDLKCSGTPLNGACNSTTYCLSGTYCSIFANMTCQPQLAAGANCTSMFDCQNNLGCYNGVCTAFGTKVLGSDVSSNTVTGFHNESNIVQYFCEVGSVNSLFQCAMYNYTATTATKVDSNGFVPCAYADQCSYTNGVDSRTDTCQCGYNPNGQGYCPVAAAYKTTDYKNAQKTLVGLTKNTCHSLNRFLCYKGDAKLQLQALTDGHKTSTAHLFYNSVSCAYDVLSSSYINLSLAFIAVVFAFLF